MSEVTTYVCEACGTEIPSDASFHPHTSVRKCVGPEERFEALYEVGLRLCPDGLDGHTFAFGFVRARLTEGEWADAMREESR